ncbi:MAG: hypothetical protein IJ619_06240 [Eubacterium sp.]|nr:hypothetical protein [Eubacterium sp.]
MLTMPQIINELAQYDIEAQRKSIYDNLAALNDFGAGGCIQASEFIY